MLRLTFIILASILFFSCKKNAPSDCSKDQYAYEFYSSSKIDTLTTDQRLFFQISSGNDIVFSYTHTGPDCKSIADEEYVDKLIFKVPATSNSFYYENNQLTEALCLFIKLASWTNGASKVTSGYVKGIKVSATKWNVEISVEIGGSVGRIVINKSFNLR